ncbi:S9 family peptidase [Gallaecimonas kandeliae]|uniref:dipeptidyl-peptidase 5 n=1 Tax=Gallaecimonas kandeliae TaxID=3029055 RepID=UPI00264962B7|nr:S9 family peptidase [Gallaecimonas kandeliae]WKE67121.1 S9 family peptidase [Gallaecimonas kandeliae]
MKKRIWALSALALSGQALAKPLTIDDVINMNKVHDAVISPDGQAMVYGLKKDGESDLYWQDLNSGTTRQLTSAKGTESDVTFSSDGKAIFFLADRGNGSQVFELDLTGGEARSVTSLPLDVQGYKLSPKGDKLVVELSVWPGCDNLKCTQDKMAELKAKKSTDMTFDKLFVRHWDTWDNHFVNHLFLAEVKDGKAGDVKDIMQGLDTDSPAKPFSGMEEVSFNNDGSQLVYSAKAPGKDHSWSTNFDLYAYDVASGQTTDLTGDNKAWDAQPAFSSDGRYMAWLAMSTPGYESDRYRIMLKDLRTNQVRELAPQWDRSADSIRFASDAKTLLVTAQDTGQHGLYAFNVDFGDMKVLSRDGTVGSVSEGAGRVLFSRDALNAPSDLYVVDKDGFGLKQLTHANEAKLKDLDMGDFAQFSFPGWNNETVYGYWIKPVGYQEGKKYPVAFLIHGGPQGSFSNHWHGRWNAELWAAAGYAVVMVDFHGSTGYGQAFTDAITGHYGDRPFEDLQKGLDFIAKQEPWIDADNACALGGSYGGYMINWIAGNWPSKFKCLVDHDGLFDLKSMYYTTEELWFPEHDMQGTPWDNGEMYDRWNPANFVKNWKTPMLVIHGEKDFRVPIGQGLGSFTALQRQGIDSRLVVFPNENHWVLHPENQKVWYKEVLAWMAKHTQAEAAAPAGK